MAMLVHQRVSYSKNTKLTQSGWAAAQEATCFRSSATVWMASCLTHQQNGANIYHYFRPQV